MSTQIQQNSFNPMFDNYEILMIRHFWRVVPRPEALLLPEKKCTSETSRSRWIYSQRPPGVFFLTSTIVISPDLLSPTPLTSSAMNTPENTEEESDDPAPANERDM